MSAEIIKIVSLPDAADLTGSEYAVITQEDVAQPSGRLTARVTLQAIADLAAGDVSSVNGQTGVVVLTTTNISEGSSLYFTAARTIASVITGFSAGSGVVDATDTILQAINKIVGNIAALVTGVSSVNSKTGVVILTTDDITTGAATQQFTNAESAKLAALTVPTYLDISAANTTLDPALPNVTANNKAASVKTNVNAPTAAAGRFSVKLENMTTNGMRFTVPAGSFIYTAFGPSSDGGYLEFSDMGTVVSLARSNTTDWILQTTTSGAITLG